MQTEFIDNTDKIFVHTMNMRMMIQDLYLCIYKIINIFVSSVQQYHFSHSFLHAARGAQYSVWLNDVLLGCWKCLVFQDVGQKLIGSLSRKKQL